MDILTPFLIVIGAFIGLLLWSHLAKVVFGIFASGKDGSPFGELTAQKTRKVLWVFFTVSLMWISAFGLLAANRPASAPNAWPWFVGGMAAAPLLAWATTIRALRKIKGPTSPRP